MSWFKLQRLRASLSSDGIGGTLLKLRAMCGDKWYDLRHSVDTCANEELNDLTILGTNRGRGYKYQTVPVLALRRSFRVIEDHLLMAGGGRGCWWIWAVEKAASC